MSVTKNSPAALNVTVLHRTYTNPASISKNVNVDLRDPHLSHPRRHPQLDSNYTEKDVC